MRERERERERESSRVSRSSSQKYFIIGSTFPLIFIIPFLLD